MSVGGASGAIQLAAISAAPGRITYNVSEVSHTHGVFDFESAAKQMYVRLSTAIVNAGG